MINSKRRNLLKIASVVLSMGALSLITGCSGNASSSSLSGSSSVESSSESSSSVETANTIALDNAISAARINKESAMVSTNGTNVIPGLYWVTAAVKTTYANAIVAAQNVSDDESSTQVVVDSEVVTLASASLIYINVKAYGTKSDQIMQTIELGQAADFGILAKTGVSTTGTTNITGNIGISPAAATYITGFDLVADATNEFSLSTYVTGQLFASDYSDPTPAYLTTAVGNMETALTNGMGLPDDATELYTGDLSGQTLPGGVYNWSNNVLINSDLTLSGSSTDTWVFQIAGTVTQAANVRVTLTGGALAQNIFWAVADTIAIGVGAHFEGTVIAQTDISMGTGSSINGRLLAQTAVTLDATTIVSPN